MTSSEEPTATKQIERIQTSAGKIQQIDKRRKTNQGITGRTNYKGQDGAMESEGDDLRDSDYIDSDSAKNTSEGSNSPESDSGENNPRTCDPDEEDDDDEGTITQRPLLARESESACKDFKVKHDRCSFQIPTLCLHLDRGRHQASHRKNILSP